MEIADTRETKAEVVARLRRWHIWRFAQLVMADRRELLRSQGRTRRQAREEAWDYVRIAFSEEQLQSVGIVDMDDWDAEST